MLRAFLDKFAGQATGYLTGLAFAAAFVGFTEARTLALRFRMRLPPPVDPMITLVALDEKFAETYDRPKVTPRAFLARVVRTVSAHEPRAIGLDYRLLRADHESPAEGEGYRDLGKAIEAAGNVVLAGQVYSAEQGAVPGKATYEWLPVPPPEHFEGIAVKGFANLWGEPVTTVPLTLPLTANPAARAPSFAFVLALFHDGLKAADLETADWDDLLDRFAVPGRQRRLLQIDYFGQARAGRPRLVSAVDLLQTPDAFPGEFFRERIVLVGSTYREPSGGDTFETPFGSMRGVEVHANVLHTLTSRSYLARPGPAVAVGATLAAAVLVGVLFRRLTLPWTVGSTLVLLGVLYPVLCFYAFSSFRVVLPMAWPVKGGFATVLLLYMTKKSEWMRLRVRSYEDLTLRLEATDDAGETVLVRALPGPGRPVEATASILLRREDPWVGLGTREQAVARWRRGDVSPDFLETLGGQLFRDLFSGDVEKAYRRATRRAWSRLGGVRLKLLAPAPALARLPWEYLYDESARRFVALRHDLVLVRSAADGQPSSSKLEAAVLEVLVLLPDTSSREVDVEWEEGLFRELATALREERAPVRLTVCSSSTASARPIAGDAGQRPQVVHVVGRSAAELGELDLEELRLLVLDVARPPRLAGPDDVVDQALARVEAGVPAVLATPVTMADRSTLLFFQTLYREMAEGRPVDEAVAAARRALFAREKARPGRDFGAPVLVTI